MIQIYNTLTKQKEEFPPLGSKIRMFVCGPTVYDYIHLGNARTFVVFDVIAKCLRYRGYKLNYIQNITDIDDKIIKRAQETGEDWKETAGKYEKVFLENMKSLKIDSVDEYPRATDHIPEIVKQVKTLIKKGNAYLIEGDPVKSRGSSATLRDNGAGGYYFDLKTFPEYGKLSGRTAEMAEDAVSRVDESSGKRNKGDFCLWKFSKEGEPSWESELGTGRPGWHIEDTAITEKYFGPQYEIHGGGQDLIFPHHEAEIAQQESASGLKPFVKYWLHVGFLVQKGEKMSKSLGGFLTVEEALKRYSPETLRFFLLSAHYRSPLDYTEENLKQAEAAVRRVGEFMEKLQKIKEKNEPADVLSENLFDKHYREDLEQFEMVMDDDFNTPKAFAHIFGFIRATNLVVTAGKLGKTSADKALEIFKAVNGIFGIIPSKIEEIPGEIQKLVDERETLRQQKDFAHADQLRKQIKNLGYEVDDTIYGPLVKKSD